MSRLMVSDIFTYNIIVPHSILVYEISTSFLLNSPCLTVGSSIIDRATDCDLLLSEIFSCLIPFATVALLIIVGMTVGVLQHTTHTRTPGSLTKVQCSHCQVALGGGGGGPRSSSSFVGLRSLSSLSESASLDGKGGGEGLRCLVRREVLDRTLIAGETAREPARDAARDTARLSALIIEINSINVNQR